ncbi:MAG: FAD-binding protein [Spirochaetales bacterium]|nr:FAD-binding protein [Spirochaetales bacterium]
MFNKINQEDIDYLADVIGDPRRFYTKDRIHEDYYHDELDTLTSPPDLLIEAISTAEVSAILKYADERSLPVTPRGQGTGLVGGSVCLHGGIMLSLTKMNRIKELDEDNGILHLEPGVLLMEIAPYLEPKGLFYPPDPGEKSATIGGNISTNAGGMRAVKYGVTRDYVRGLEIVLAGGKVIHTGGSVAKNSSGYSIKDLIIGSEGTLGIITGASLRILSLPPVTVSLLIPFENLETAINAVPFIARAKQIPTAIEFMQQEVILAAADYLGRQFPDTSSEAYLLVSCDGPDRNVVDMALDDVAEIALAHGAKDALISDTPERQEAVWSARGTFLEAIKASTTEMDECDVVVPRMEIAGFIRYCGELEKKYGIRIMSFGHAGDGNLHLYALRDNLDEATWKKKLKTIFDLMYKRADDIGGKVSGEHGIGFAKMEYLENSEETPIMALLSGIKKVFDPKGIMNPGKIVR